MTCTDKGDDDEQDGDRGSGVMTCTDKGDDDEQDGTEAVG